MNAGDTFYVRDRSVDTHLWVIISDPERDSECVVIVSVTIYEPHQEDVCLLNAGEHPRVTHQSCVAYNEARTITLDQLTSLRDEGKLSVQSPVSASILSKIRAGVSRSRRIKAQYLEWLLDQGVTD